MKTPVIIKDFNDLTLNELYEILLLRSKVFVVEQNCAYQDIDGQDKISIHVFTLFEDGSCSSCARIIPLGDGVFRIGRLIASIRKSGFGMTTLRACIEECKRLGAKDIFIEAQQYALGFYEKAGFHPCSEVFYEDGIPHVEMTLRV